MELAVSTCIELHAHQLVIANQPTTAPGNYSFLASI